MTRNTHQIQGLVDVPLSSNGSLGCVEALQKFGRVTDNLSVNGRMIDGDAPLGHHLLKILETEIISQVPPHAEQYHRAIKMPALEQRRLHDCDQEVSG